MKSKSIFIKGIKVHPFPSDSSLLEYVEEHKGILVAINAEKIDVYKRQPDIRISLRVATYLESTRNQ